MKTVTSDGIQTLDAPELRRRSAIVVSRLRTCIDVCKRVLLEKFQDTQCDAAGKLSQSIYVVESLLGKCHQEGDLLFFTIRQDPQVSIEWFRFGHILKKVSQITILNVFTLGTIRKRRLL